MKRGGERVDAVLQRVDLGLGGSDGDGGRNAQGEADRGKRRTGPGLIAGQVAQREPHRDRRAPTDDGEPADGQRAKEQHPASRSAHDASCASWVTTTPATAPWHAVRIRRITASVLTESSAPDGSSASSRRRSPTTARAIATRCRSPPDSSSGNRAARSARPRSASAASAAVRAVLAAIPSSSSGRATFSVAVSPASRLKSWNTYPIERRRSLARSLRDIPDTTAPPTSTSPLSGSSRLPTIVSRVLLPDPLGPSPPPACPPPPAGRRRGEPAPESAPSRRPWTPAAARARSPPRPHVPSQPRQ